MPNIVTLTPSTICSVPIPIGERGENVCSAVRFDFTEWADEYGEGAVSLLVKRKGDTSAYPVVVPVSEHVATWTISNTDTAVHGYGKAEFVFTLGDLIAKTAVFSIYVANDIGPNGEPPEPIQEWMDELVALGGETLINAQAAQAAQEAAETAQTAAETAATNAATSATNAAQSAGSARFAAESALSSADRATASATAASGHATAAEAAKDLAISAAESAQHSETQAELSASAAAESAESASGSAAQAQQSASNASQSATQASNSATNAAASATSASGSASAAASSESNAAQSATSAAASATEAATEAAKLNNYLPVDTASGAIASFPDGASGVPVEALTISLEPIQSGSGTPSPDNVRPITGHTAVEVWRSGVNVWDEEWEVGGIDANTGIDVSDSTRIRSKNYIRVKPSASYYTTGRISWFEYDANHQFLFRGNSGAYIENAAFTVGAGTKYIRFIVSSNYGTTYNNDISINYPSTDHDYHAHSIANISIPLGQTVYGGTIDVVGGVCTVDRACVDLGALTWQSGFQGFYSTTIKNDITAPSDYAVPTAICSMYPWSNSGNNAFFVQAYPEYRGWVVVRTTDYSTPADFKTAMSGVQLCYELNTPIEIPLTANQLSTLYGQNNVWSDSGDVSITYRADIQLYIQKYITKVISEALS